jgi:hypothetical protein
MAAVNTLTEINRIINVATFTLSLIMQTAFFLRFKFKADRAATSILLIYLAVNGFRIAVNKNLFGIIDILVTPTTTVLIFSLLYFFVFEMSYIRAMLNA